MTKVFTVDQIKAVIKPEEVIEVIEEGFKLMAQDKVVIAPLSSLNIENSGVAKVKYGYIKGQDTYVVKVGSFFPNNKLKKKQTINASMQVYNQNTGEFEALLLDEAYLTNIRTAAAGAIITKHFSPQEITKIGIIGTGIQAHLQLQYLRFVTDCKKAIVWGRNPQHCEQYKEDMEQKGFSVEIAPNIETLASECNVIITTTSTTNPIIFANHIQLGTLVISVGADTKEKQEIDPHLLQKADILIGDSKEQCIKLGNIAHAIQNGTITDDKVLELGSIIQKGIENKDQLIIVANLTGVAVQDIQIANLAYQKLL